MIATSPELAAILASRAFHRAEVCRVFLPDETTPIRLSTANYPVTGPASEVFSPAGPLLERGTIRKEAGLKSQTLELKITPGPTDLIYGRSWRRCLNDGIFDGARVEYLFAFSPLAAPGDCTAGLMLQFTGEVADAVPNGLQLVFRCEDPLRLLDTPHPRFVYQTQCPYILFSPSCGLDRADFLETETVGASPTTLSIPITNAQPTGYFDLGQVRFTSGPCWGIRRMIRSWNGTALTLASALPRAPEAGDGLELLPGCKKNESACTALGNDQHRDFPFIPVAETAV